MDNRKARMSRSAALVIGAGLLTAPSSGTVASEPVQAQGQATDLHSICTPQGMSSVVAGVARGITVKTVPDGPHFDGGVRFVAASGKLPAFCQVTGSYVTNPKTGKTANFIATFPERWNGKYLQLGCSGACGYLLMNDPTSPPIVITAEGYPGQLIEKGYASFGNDLGHELPSPMTMSFDWLKGPHGGVNMDTLEDYLYRADLVMADTGKAFTRAVYSRQSGRRAAIVKSYFNGCSQGGREALVAATQFPEKFDGIIAGSPVSDSPGTIFQGVAFGLFAQQPGLAKLTAGQVAMLDKFVIDKCDAVDGVKDGLIQNPAACNIHPTRDLPICASGQVSDNCVTKPQAELISAWISGATDEQGHVLQPGYAIGALSFGFVAPMPAGAPVDSHVSFIVGNSAGGRPIAMVREGGPGPITGYHAVLNGAAYRKYLEVMRKGTILPQDFSRLINEHGKLLWYHDLADEALTPYMSINRYKRLAQMHGGYANLKRNIRFFTVPGTGHCGMGGDGAGNFDAIGALEGWIERGKAPEALLARHEDLGSLLSGRVDWSKPSPRTMPLCAFPEMAHYKGSGDVNVASSWECRAGDTRMLGVGVSGQQAGVVDGDVADNSVRKRAGHHG